MFKKSVISVAIVAMFSVSNAHAWGLTDLVGVGLQAGGKLIGAGIDKASDAMRNPEAEAAQKREEERKAAEEFKKVADEIEAKTGLRPIEREKLVLSMQQSKEFAAQMQSLVAQSEEQQKAERDKIFTTSGFLGVIGSAAANQAVVHTAVNDPAAMKKIGQVEDAANKASTASAVATVLDTGKEKTAAGGASSVPVATTTRQSNGDLVAATAPDALSIDLGKAVFIEFVGSPSNTLVFEKVLTEHGHHLVSSKEQADVVYVIEGEYAVPETKMYSGLMKDLGGMLENPSEVLPVPEKKLSGSVSKGLSSFMLAVAKAQGQKVPDVPTREDGVYAQRVLLVMARQPKVGKESRYSILKKVESKNLDGVKMGGDAVKELFLNLGLVGGAPT